MPILVRLHRLIAAIVLTSLLRLMRAAFRFLNVRNFGLNRNRERERGNARNDYNERPQENLRHADSVEHFACRFNAIDQRCVLCYAFIEVMSRHALSFLLAMTVGLASVPLVPARTCILTDSHQKACAPKCCANKTCCATSEKTRALPTQPLAKSDASSQTDLPFATMTAVVVMNSDLPIPQFVSADFAPSGHSPPRLALLCSLLI